MIHFHDISLKTFLHEYWQKKPLVIRNALPNFINPLTPDELAGLALEEEAESRIVWETPGTPPGWHLKRGPFNEKDFQTLPPSHWTLLVQGVDRLVPDVYALLDHFDFLPQWRVDDIMISFAALHGGVGPHYDNYDVFLYQALGKRQWSLTTQGCTQENYLQELELRIMKDFAVEEQIILEEGDMLYLPPHVGHNGISLSEECMTYSFGYRSYQGQELWDSFGDYLSEKGAFSDLYRDPDWSPLQHTSAIPQEAWKQARVLLQKALHDEKMMQSWFGCFATRLDQQAEQQLPMPLEEDELIERAQFINALKNGVNLMRNASCRFAYDENRLYINGCEWDTADSSPELMHLLANHRFIQHDRLLPYLNTADNQQLIYDLWTLQWLQEEAGQTHLNNQN